MSRSTTKVHRVTPSPVNVKLKVEARRMRQVTVSRFRPLRLNIRVKCGIMTRVQMRVWMRKVHKVTPRPVKFKLRVEARR